MWRVALCSPLFLFHKDDRMFWIKKEKINMYELYRKVKNNIQKLDDMCYKFETKWNRNDYAYYYNLYLEFVELKQGFYNENINDEHLVEKYNQLVSEM